MQVSVLGAGWLGKALAISLSDRGYDVKASSRNLNSIEELKSKGIAIYQIDYDHEKGLKGDLEFFNCEILIICMSPGRNLNLQNNYSDAIAYYLKQAKESQVQKLIFTSSTGVYGEQEGILTEETPIRPQTASSRQVAKAEYLIQDSGIPFYIFRLAGLIGPGRDPGSFLAGKQNVPGPNSPVNLISQTQLINIFHKVLESNIPNGIYNICADDHPSKEILYTKRAINSGLEPPQFDFAGESTYRIVSNEKIKNFLALPGIELED